MADGYNLILGLEHGQISRFQKKNLNEVVELLWKSYYEIYVRANDHTISRLWLLLLDVIFDFPFLKMEMYWNWAVCNEAKGDFHQWHTLIKLSWMSGCNMANGSCNWTKVDKMTALMSLNETSGDMFSVFFTWV